MAFLVDTDVAIHLRDHEPSVRSRFHGLPSLPSLSVISQVELEGGVYAVAALTERRRERLDALLSALRVIDFDQHAAGAYRSIVAHNGFSRRKITDRMIAATAIAYDLTLITINAADFRDIPDLALEVWPAPVAQ